MKTGSLRRLRRQFAADVPVFGLWITLEPPSITEIMVDEKWAMAAAPFAPTSPDGSVIHSSVK